MKITRVLVAILALVVGAQAQTSIPPPSGTASIPTNLTPATLTAGIYVSTPELRLNGATYTTIPTNKPDVTIADSANTWPGATPITLLSDGTGPAFTLYPVTGESGITVRVANGALIISGAVTNGVEVYFPVQTSSVGRFYYRSSVAPYTMSYVDMNASTSGYFKWDGTNVTPVQELTATATNALALNNQPSTYYDDFFNLTNALVYNSGVLAATDVMGFEAGSNCVFTFVTYTNALTGRVGTIARISGGSGGSNYLLNAVNTWSDTNTFQQPLYANRIIVQGQGNTMSGDKAQVLGGTNNTAAGAYSTVLGGYGNLAGAGAPYGTVAGGLNNTASGSRGAVAGGEGNQAGDFSGVGGGYEVDIDSPYSFGAGAHLDASAGKSYVFMFGYGYVTNPLNAGESKAFIISGYDGGMKLLVNTMSSRTAGVVADIAGTARVDAVKFPDDTILSSAAGASVTWLGPSSFSQVLSRVRFTGPAITNLVYDTNTGEIIVGTKDDSAAGVGITSIVNGASTTNNGITQFVLANSSVTTNSAGQLVFTITNAIGGSGGGGSVNFTSTWSVATTHGSTSAVMVGFGVSNTVLASTGPTSAPVFLTLAQLGAPTGTPLYAFTESDPNWAAVSNSIRSDINASALDTEITNFVERIGETDGIDFTNAASVSVPTPSAASHAATKGYVDSASSASVTNAIDKGLANSGSLLTGLNTLDIVGQGRTMVSNQAAGPTGRWYITSSEVYTETATGVIRPTNSAHSITGNYSVIGGGFENEISVANATESTIGGGYRNRIKTTAAARNTISGGQENEIQSQSTAAIGGGMYNVIKQGGASVIGGGRQNVIDVNADPAANVIDGGYQNSISNGAEIVTIGGGIYNKIYLGDYGVIGGGILNYVYGEGGTVGGGGYNSATGNYSAVGGGKGNMARGPNSVVAGGETNVAHGAHSAVAGGKNNRLTGTATYGFIGGGLDNLINETLYGVIAGGYDNDVYNGSYITVGGGYQNYAEEDGATVAGGSGNSARGNHGAIGGGSGNNIATGGANNDGATIGGGYYNTIAASAEQHDTIGGGGFNMIAGNAYAATIAGGHGNTTTVYEAAIPGGRLNRVEGRASFAAGTMAHAPHEGSFVFSDRFQGLTGSVFTTSSSNQAAFRVNGGMFITRTNTTAVPVTGATLTVEGNIYVSGAGFFGSNSVYVGQTHLGETQLKTIYRDTTMARWLAVGFSLLLLNFIRDRKRERANRKRDTELLNRIKELEAR